MNWITTFLGSTRARLLQRLRRSAAPIADLAGEAGITGNAVRGHVAALQRDGLVREAGTAPSTGGKPAQLYDLTARGEELFPKAYALVLREMIRMLEERFGREAARDLLREVGRRAAAGVAQPGGEREARVLAAAEALRSIGGDVAVSRGDGGWDIRGFGCPLSTVVTGEPDACAVARGLVAEVAGTDVEERCDRSGERPRCAFRVADG